MNTYIVDAIRTPIGNFGGTLKNVRADDLSAITLKELLKRNLIDPKKIDDVIIGIIKILKSNKSSGEIFNIGTGKPVQIKQVIKKICKIIGKGKPIFGKINFRSDEIVKLYPNINKIQKVINWNPKIKLNNGLSKTINYYKKNG